MFRGKSTNVVLATLSFLLVYTLIHIACSNDEILSPSPALKVSENNITVDPPITQAKFSITNSGAGDLKWSVTPDSAWLTVDPSEGTGADTITLTIDRGVLEPGPHTSRIMITSNGGEDSVAVLVNQAGFSLSPVELNLGADKDSILFDIANSGSGTLTWSITENISWLEVNPLESPPAEENETITVAVDRSVVVPGFYEDKIYISSNSGDKSISVKMIKPEPAPILHVSEDTLLLDPPQSTSEFSISNDGGQTLEWKLIPDSIWLSAVPDSGMGDATISVEIDRGSMSPGEHSAKIMIESNGGDDSVVVIANQPRLSVSRNSLDFGNADESEQFDIANIGTGTLTWSINENISWLDLDKTSSPPENATITATVNRDPLSPGTYFGYINITSNGGNKSLYVEMQKLAPTMVRFRGSGLSRPLKVYLDGSEIGTLSAPAWLVEKEVSEGTHSYYFGDESCGLRTSENSVTIAANTTRNVYVSTGDLGFIFEAMGVVSASQGTYEDRVEVSWPELSPRPPHYAVWRSTWLGSDWSSWTPLNDAITNSYTDRSVSPRTQYSYAVIPVWDCTYGEFGYSQTTGFTKSARFYNMSINVDDGAKKVYLEIKLELWGMKDEKHAYGSFWYNSDWTTACNNCTNTTLNCSGCGNDLGLVSSITQSSLISTWTIKQSYPYGCFKDYSGKKFWGRYKFFRESSPNCTGGMVSYGDFWVCFYCPGSGISLAAASTNRLTQDEPNESESEFSKTRGTGTNSGSIESVSSMNNVAAMVIQEQSVTTQIPAPNRSNPLKQSDNK